MSAQRREGHTEGPWSYRYREEIPEEGGRQYHAITAQNGEITVAETDPTDNGEANARLIAQAPALLEACIKMVARFEQLSQDRSIPIADELCIMADAISRATNGKHPMAQGDRRAATGKE